MRPGAPSIGKTPVQSRSGRLFSWLLLVLCLGFILYFFATNQEGIRLLLQIHAGPFLALLFLQFTYLIVHGYRFQIVLEKCSGREIGFRPWFRIYVLGRFLNMIVPQLGAIYRSVRLKKDYQITYTRYVSGFFSHAWLGCSFNLVAALVMIVLLSPDLRIGPVQAIYPVLGLVVVLGLGPVLLEALWSVRVIEVRALSWLHAKLAEMLRVSVQSLRDRAYLTRFLLLALVLLVQACAIFYLCFLSLGIPVEPAAVILFYVLLQLSTYVNVTPGNLGVQEIAFGLLADQMGIGMGEGMLVSVLLRVTGYIALFAVALAMGGLGVLRQAERYRSEADDS